MNKTITALSFCIAACTLFFTISVTGCKPEKTATPSHCSNGIKDNDETGVDCGGSCNACGSGNLPVACFTSAGGTVQKDSLVSFTNCSQNATGYSWAFGDGGTSTQQQASHTYTTAGTYKVTLVATNTNGADTTEQNINVAAAPNAAFLGSFSAADVCTSGTYSFQSTITAGSSGNSIIISNFSDYNASVTATVSGSSITISPQTVNGYTFNGTGTISNNNAVINFTFTVSAQGQTDNCTSAYTRM